MVVVVEEVVDDGLPVVVVVLLDVVVDGLVVGVVLVLLVGRVVDVVPAVLEGRVVLLSSVLKLKLGFVGSTTPEQAKSPNAITKIRNANGTFQISSDGSVRIRRKRG